MSGLRPASGGVASGIGGINVEALSAPCKADRRLMSALTWWRGRRKTVVIVLALRGDASLIVGDVASASRVVAMAEKINRELAVIFHAVSVMSKSQLTTL